VTGSGNQDDSSALNRLLRPASVALVGATDDAVMAQTPASIVDLDDVETFLVNPRRPTVYGRPTVESLTSIGRPVDAVFSLLSAERTADLAEEAADLRCGGLVAIASGFAEMGAAGEALQQRLVDAARRANMAVVGPNGVGYIHVQRGLEMTFLPRFERRRGGVSVVAHSGALLEAFAASAWRPGGVGLNYLVSAGNEAVTDLADYLDFLVDDPDTTVIVLAMEKIRRPDAFFAAARRARTAGKPVVAVKLGRSERSRAMARSHTGTITGDSWTYEVALRQAGIALARDVDEAVDRVQFLEQLPPDKWSAVKGLAVLTGTGGFASLAVDLAKEEGVDVPDVPRLNEWVGEVVPGAEFANPLDATGFVVSQPEIWNRVLDLYATAPEFDAYVYLSQFAGWDLRSRRFGDAFAELASRTSKPCFVSSLAGTAGAWVDEYRSQQGVGVGNGTRSTLLGLATMARHVRTRADAAVQPASTVPVVARPASGWVDSDDGSMLTFADTMDLLQDFGIACAPFHIVGGDDDDELRPQFAGPFVVKLADVAHRTDIGAVLVAVPPSELRAAVEKMRAIAAEHSLPSTVVIQPMLESTGEVFLGLTGRSELGPLVAFGIGGVFVEVVRRIGGRMAPLSAADAGELLAEFDDLKVMSGVRGQPAWDRVALQSLLEAAGRLAAAGRDWIDTMDINPLLITANGPVAVDAACFPLQD